MSLYDEDEIMEDPPSFDEEIGVPLDDEDMEDQVTKQINYYLMPCPFTGPKMFACPNFLSQPRDLTAFSASSNILCRH